jgi:hypothetical protein
MDEPTSPTPAPADRRWRDWRWLVLLFLLVAPIRGWLLWNTEVIARDGVGYIRYALQFEARPWGDVVRSFDQHPGYPFAIWLASMPVRALVGDATPEAMRLSAQLVSGLATVLLIVPMFYLGKTLWDARIGFGGALLFQLLPMSGHHLSDGISEALFVLLVAGSLLGGVHGVQTGRPGWFLLCGTSGGLAYLTRPEGALVPVAVLLTIVAMQVNRAWRQAWAAAARQCGCLALSALCIAAPYMAAIGGISTKRSVNQLGATFVMALPPAETAPRSPELRGQLWAETFKDVRSIDQRFLHAGWALFIEICFAMHYLGFFAALIALAWHGRSMCGERGFWVLGFYFLLHMSALVLLSLSAGYMSDRHLMPLLMLFCFLAMQGTFVTVAGLLACATALRSSLTWPQWALPTAAFALLAVDLGCCLPQTLRRLHAERAPNRQAGLWLAARVKPGDLVLDDHAWSHFYAGQVFAEFKQTALAAEARPTCFVVMTRSHDPKVAEIRRQIERQLRLRKKSEIIFHWPRSAQVDEARVVIHALPRNPRTHPWTVAP